MQNLALFPKNLRNQGVSAYLPDAGLLGDTQHTPYVGGRLFRMGTAVRKVAGMVVGRSAISGYPCQGATTLAASAGWTRRKSPLPRGCDALDFDLRRRVQDESVVGRSAHDTRGGGVGDHAGIVRLRERHDLTDAEDVLLDQAPGGCRRDAGSEWQRGQDGVSLGDRMRRDDAGVGFRPDALEPGKRPLVSQMRLHHRRHQNGGV